MFLVAFFFLFQSEKTGKQSAGSGSESKLNSKSTEYKTIKIINNENKCTL